MSDVVAISGHGVEKSVAAVAFAFLDAGIEIERLEATIVDELARALSATCRFSTARDVANDRRIVLPLAGASRSLVVERDHAFIDSETVLARELADHAAIALINADRVRAASDEARHAKDALHDGLLRFARLGQTGMLGVAVGSLDARIRDINEAFANIVGYSRDEIMSPSFNWTSLTPDEFRLADTRARVELQTSGTAR